MNLLQTLPNHVQDIIVTAEAESFTQANLARVTRPCVYAFMKDGKPLYVGFSVAGIVRFASPNHHHSDVRDLADEIVVLWFDDAQKARYAEGVLIKTLQPLFNGNGFRTEPPTLPRKRRPKGAGCLVKIGTCRYWYAQYYDDHKKIRVSTKTEDKVQALAVLQQLVSERDQRAQSRPAGAAA